MNDIRSSYVKVLPLIFLTGLLSAGLHLYHDIRFNYPRPGDTLELLISALRYGLIWTIIGWAFKRKKEAVIAFGSAIVLFIIDYFLRKSVSQNALYFFVHILLSDYAFIPALVFGWLCFKTRGLTYFLPVALFVYALPIFQYGSGHLTELTSNRYAWSGINYFLTLNRYFNLPYYLFELAAVCLTFILICECYYAAATQKEWKNLFLIDFSTRYTKRAGLILFYTFRLAIDIFIVGLFSYPLSNLVYNNLSPASSLLLNLTSGLGLLALAALYYRKFLAEYFISIQKKINWLFWLVNVPLLGLLVFPFVVLSNRLTDTIGERTLFFNNIALGKKPYIVLAALVVLHLLRLPYSPPFDGNNALFWVIYCMEMALIILYVAEAWGFYVMLSINGVCFLYFLFTTLIAVSQNDSRQLPFPSYLQQGTIKVVQYAILFPVFYLKRFDKAEVVSTGQ